MVRREQSLKKVFEVCLELAQAHYGNQGPPRKRGHPWTYPWALYLALLLFRAYLGTTYRRTVVVYQDLFPRRPCPSFQSLHRFAKRVSAQELAELQTQLARRLRPFLPEEESTLLILDSTGLPCRSKGQALKWRRGREVRQVRGHSRLCCLVRYFPKEKLLVVEGVAVGPAYAPDTKLGEMALVQVESSGPLLADAGFDGGEVWAKVEEKGLEPHIPLKGGGEVRDERRKKARQVFSPALYRLRAVGEGLFGALKTKLACGFLQETLPLMAQKRAFLEAVAYNLRVFLTLFLPLSWILGSLLPVSLISKTSPLLVDSHLHAEFSSSAARQARAGKEALA